MAGAVSNRARVLGGTFVIAFSFWVTLIVLDIVDQKGPATTIAPKSQPSGPTVPVPADDPSALPARMAETSGLRDLPQAVPGFPYQASWDGIDGLNARVVGAAPIPGRGSALSLVAAQEQGRHRLGVQFAGIPIGRPVTIMVWLGAPAGTRIVIDIRDGHGKDGVSPNQGAAAFDLSTPRTLSSTGALQGAVVEIAPAGWVKVSAQTSSADGQLVIYVGLLGPGDADTFNGSGQRMIFGGIELTS